MFRTYPESELPLIPGLVRNGERSWQWIELPLQITYFMATIRIGDIEHAFLKSILFSDIRSVLEVASETNDSLKLERVDVLIPGYLHQDNGYKLAQLKEVWMSGRGDGVTSYVFADGSQIYDSFHSGNESQDTDMHLVATF